MSDLKGVDDVGNVKMRKSMSRLSGERPFDPVATESKHVSTLPFEDNPKCDEADTRSSDGGIPTQPTSVKSAISTETHLPPGDGSFEMVVEKTHGSQLRTESSCSNSLPVVLPVSFSNQSFQETSKEACLFRNCGSSMDSSNSKAFDRSPEEPVTASSESGVSGHIFSKAIRNAKSGNSMRISSKAEDNCSLTIKKGGEEISRKWSHGTTTPEDDVGEVLEQTDNLDCFNCTNKSTVSTRLSDGHDNLLTSHAGERMEYEISREGEDVLAVKGKAIESGPEVMDKIRGDFCASEFSDSLMAKQSKYAVKDEEKTIAGFDLNEDISSNVLDDCVHPVFATASSPGVIHVIAKAGIPTGQPMIPLKFVGGLGWKGSAETSAFRPPLSKNSDRKSCYTDHRPKDEGCFTGIDLNIAAIEDDDANETHSEVVDSRQAKSLGIDLNCLYDATDEFTQPSPPPMSDNRSRIDFNLYSDTSVALKSSNVHWLGQGSKALDTSNPAKQDFSIISHDYVSNLSTMRHLANRGHSLAAAPYFLQPMESIQKVASMQPKLPPISHTLPPHSYSYKDPFHFGVGSIPYTRYYGEHVSFNAPHLGQVVYEQSTSNMSAFIPKFDEKTEGNLSVGGSKTDMPRQFPFLAKSSPMTEHMHQEAWYAAASMKRKEPEGGLDCFQLGYKHVT